MHVLSKYASSALALTGIVVSACSVLYDLSPDQCGPDADCASFGENFVCRNGLCVGPTGSGGKGGSGGTGRGGTAGSAGRGGEGNASQGGSSGGTTGGIAGEGGVGGVVSTDECATTKECLDIHGVAKPSVCVEGSCVELRTEQCPVLQPTIGQKFLDNLRGRDPIILGAYASLGDSLVSKTSRNYDLAVNEVTEEYGGLPGTSGTRPVVFLVCKNNYESRSELDESIAHLTQELKVPGIVSALLADDLQYAFEQSQISAQAGDSPNVLFMSPLEWSSSLGNIEDQNLLWHLLPGGNYVALPYAPLLTRSIEYMKAHGGVPSGETIRVALVTATDERLLSDMSDAVYKSISFNGKTAAQNRADENLLSVAVTSYYTDANASLATQIDTILEFRPHIILALTANELFSRILPAVEAGWTRDAPVPPWKPFYIVSPYNYNNSQLANVVQTVPAIELRLAGVNFASAPPPQAELDQYENAFDSAYPEVAGTRGYENFYDAAYYLMYGIVGAGKNVPNLTGDEIAAGMKRLLSGPRYGVGHEDVVAAFTTLSPAQNKITLNGTLGPPSFDTSGARSDPGSVWCVDGNAKQEIDVLRVNESGELYDPDPSDAEFPCNPNF